MRALEITRVINAQEVANAQYAICTWIAVVCCKSKRSFMLCVCLRVALRGNGSVGELMEWATYVQRYYDKCRGSRKIDRLREM